MGDALLPCPCGKVPSKLWVDEGSTFRWRYVSGDCGCGWMIEARINSASGSDDEFKECAEAWNAMPRAGREV